MGKPSSNNGSSRRVRSSYQTRAPATPRRSRGGSEELFYRRRRNSSSNLLSKPSKMNITMSSSKLSKRKVKNRRRVENNIKKLFNDLRNSTTEIVDVDNTIINLDDSGPSTSNDKLIDEIILNHHKRKLSSEDLNASTHVNKRTKTSNVLVINDEPEVVNTQSTTFLTPRKPSTVQCSTPIQIHDNPSTENNNASALKNFNTDISNLTKEINEESYLTIDLTNETLNCSSISKENNTVINLDDTHEHNDCTTKSNASSMSNDSEVTVLYMPLKKKQSSNKDIQDVVKGISSMNASKKAKMLESIVKTLLNGCEVPEKLKSVAESLAFKESASKGTTTAEDTYIREMITGQSTSRNSIGSNIYNPQRDKGCRHGLRMIVIDGSNVAMGFSKGREFNVEALKDCIEYFLQRGHVVKAFVPRFRCKYGKSTNPRLLDELERRGHVVYTPSREVNGRRITSYDDRYIVQCAAEFNAVIVTGDNYRDLLRENTRWRSVIENNILTPIFVDKMIMFPEDPLGRNGPKLAQFLRHSQTNCKCSK